jgi:hypothetical protein
VYPPINGRGWAPVLYRWCRAFYLSPGVGKREVVVYAKPGFYVDFTRIAPTGDRVLWCAYGYSGGTYMICHIRSYAREGY